MRKQKITLITIAMMAVAALALTGCAGFNTGGVSGAGKVCNSQGCVSYTFSPGSGSPSAPGSPAPASTYLTPTPQGESASASVPGVTQSPAYATQTGTPTPPPTPTQAVPTSSPVPQAQFDSSLHRCKQSSAVNTLVSVSLLSNQQPAYDLFSCMQLPPDQVNLLIKLLVLAVYDALTHQPFNPPAQYAPQAQQAQDVVTAYKGS